MTEGLAKSPRDRMLTSNTGFATPRLCRHSSVRLLTPMSTMTQVMTDSLPKLVAQVGRDSSAAMVANSSVAPL